MELTTVIITSFTLLTIGVFVFVYSRYLKQQKQLSDNRSKETVAKLENINKNLTDLISKEFSDLKTQNETVNNVLINEITELKKTIFANIKEFSTNYEIQNKQVIEAFKDNHNETLKSLKDELMKILKEIKAPLDLD